MSVIKQSPEDFHVIERIEPELNAQGRFALFWLTKKGTSQMLAIEKIARFFGVPLKQVGFAGTKDKDALTEQLISVAASASRARNAERDFMNDALQLRYVGQSKKPISLGDNEGNGFTIVIRDLTSFEKEKLENVPSKIIVPNYFDEQRFSTNNVAIGRALLKKDWKTAMTLIDLPVALEQLEACPTDYIGAIKKVPHKIAKFYMNAFQSRLFNALLCSHAQKHFPKGRLQEYSQGVFYFPEQVDALPGLTLPLPGFGTEDLDPDVAILLEGLLQEEGIRLQDFITRSIPELASAGDERQAYILVQEVKVRMEGTTAIVSFTLPKGSYATIVLKSVM